MNKKFLLLPALIILSGCSSEELPPVPQAVVVPKMQVLPQQPKKEVIKYVYSGDKVRDPFISLTAEGISAGSDYEEIIAPNINSLVLKGIISDGAHNMIAMISGGGTSYILKQNQLFDNRNRLIKGVTGTITKESVILRQDKTSKELRIRAKY